MKLNVGCGSVRKEGYINIEAKRTSASDMVGNALQLDQKFRPNSIDEIYSSHMFEHLDKKDASEFLDICHKLLKKQATLFLAIPCLDYVVDLWMQKKMTDEEFINSLHGIQRDPYDHHRMSYTIATFTKLVESKGFKKIKQEKGRPGYGVNSPGIMCWFIKC